MNRNGYRSKLYKIVSYECEYEIIRLSVLNRKKTEKIYWPKFVL